MSRCVNCGRDNRNGNDVCARCEEQWRENADREEWEREQAERSDRQEEQP